jgi:hypothetical protein
MLQRLKLSLNIHLLRTKLLECKLQFQISF